MTKEEKLRKECLKKLESFMGQGDEYNGIMLWLPETSEIFHVMFGDGDNLDEEDYENALDAYLCINVYKYNHPDFEEVDGGDLLYSSLTASYDDDICNTVYDALDFIYDCCPEFIPLALFNH